MKKQCYNAEKQKNGGCFMEYKQLCGEKLSRLGMGNMRLPTKDGKIDTQMAQEMIDHLIAQGINYFDTAYMYHGGESEKFIGKALSKYPRDSYYLATKMPSYKLSEGCTPQEIFEEQLAKCGVDHFDFYLLHNLNENSFDIFTDQERGVIPYLLEQKRLGRIRHLGVSSHAKPETLRRFLDQVDCMEFVQIQLNYLDWEMQDAKQQYEIIASHGLPVWVMEPCRGGRLASLCPAADKLLLGAAPERSIASWAFRYVMGLGQVGVVLSGMSDMAQVNDNISTFSENKPLTTEEQAVLQQALSLFRAEVNVPCTACHYCDGCPGGLDIPAVLAIYNEYQLEKSPFVHKELESQKAGPSDCISCGTCVTKCPQNIAIPQVMEEFANILKTVPKPKD